LDRDAINDIRLALNQNQPLGNERFCAKIEQMTGIRREAKPRGRPRMKASLGESIQPGQDEFVME
jgi:putative transposase